MDSGMRQYSPADFLYGPKLGEGRFGTVIYAEVKTPGTANDASNDSSNDVHHDASPHQENYAQHQNDGYAIKMIPKSEIMRHNQIHAVMTEKHILTEILSSKQENGLPGSELCMKLFLCFHDANCLYLVLELCAGGTLLDLIRSQVGNSTDDDTPVMDISWIRYYAAQILRAIEYLHQRGVIHRDISPQNIGITFPTGEVKLGDFGSAAVFVKEDCDGTVMLKRWTPPGTYSSISESGDFVGTADYVSPEMIRGSDEDTEECQQCAAFPAMDLWSFGCLVYHMFVGKSPFHAESDHLAIQSVLDYANGKSELLFPQCVGKDAREFVSSLLSINSASRLGMQDDVMGSSISCCNSLEGEQTQRLPRKQYASIRNHSFFQTDKDTSFWDLDESKSTEPPYSPAKPEWMAALNQGDTTLTSLESIQFDL